MERKAKIRQNSKRRKLLLRRFKKVTNENASFKNEAGISLALFGIFLSLGIAMLPPDNTCSDKQWIDKLNDLYIFSQVWAAASFFVMGFLAIYSSSFLLNIKSDDQFRLLSGLVIISGVVVLVLLNVIML